MPLARFYRYTKRVTFFAGSTSGDIESCQNGRNHEVSVGLDVFLEDEAGVEGYLLKAVSCRLHLE
jgi:hypothetical protein